MPDTTPQTPSVSEAFKKMQLIRKELNTYFLEKADSVDLLLLSMLSRMHTTFIGDPGEAKTNLIDSLTHRIEGVQNFKILVMKTSTPEELFGLYNPAQLMQGVYEHMIAGMAPEAHILYLDEGFKGSPAFLNGTLGLLNEREFRNGSRGMVKTPLHFAVISSNEMPPQGDENLQALWDRILYRQFTGTLSETGHQQFMRDELARLALRAQGQPVDGSEGTTISLAEVELLQRSALRVQVPQPVLDAWFRLRNELESAGYGKSSTRRSGWILRAIMAHALLHGRKAATLDDLSILQFILWNQKKDIAQIVKLVLQVANPLTYEARDWADKIPVIMDTCMVEVRQAGENALQRESAVTKARKDLEDVRSKLEGYFLQARGLGLDVQQIQRWGQECELMMKRATALITIPKRLTTFDEAPVEATIED